MTFDSAWNTFWMVVLRLGALALGLYLAWCELSGTYDYFMADQNQIFNYIVKMMLGVTAFTAMAPALMSAAWAARRFGTLFFMVLALPLAVAIVFSAAVSRTGGSADNSEAQRIKNERALDLARKTETEATDALANATAEAKKECNTGSGTGRGKKCEEAEAKRDKAADKVDAARATINGINNPRKDPWFSRAAALSEGRVTEEQMRTYWPLLYPLVVSLAAGILLAFGVHSGRRPAPQPAPMRAPRERKPWGFRKAEPRVTEVAAPAAESPITAPVTQQRVDVHVDPTARRSPFRRPAPTLKLVASNANVAMGGILDFIIEGLESGNGERLSEKDVYKGYAKRCREAGIKPASIEEFVLLLDRACNECGIEREHKSGKVYLMDVQLVKAALTG